MVVGEALEGRQGLALAEHLQPDLIILDMSMPVMNGMEVARALQTWPRAPKFVFLSMEDGAGYAAAALAMGALAFINKSDLVTGLLPVIKRLVDGLSIACPEQSASSKLSSLPEAALSQMDMGMPASSSLDHLTARVAHQALAAISQGVLISGADRKILFVNSAFERMTGYSEVELLGTSCAMLQGPLTNPETVEEMRAALVAEQPFNAELLNYRKDGTPFWNELSLNPVFDLNGTLTNFVGVQRDVTVSKEQQIQLQLASKVAEQTREGILVTDAQRNILMVNQAFSTITGYEPEEVIGRNSRIVRSRRLSDLEYSGIRQTIDTQGHWQGELLQRRKDGSEYQEWTTASVVRDAQGRITHRVITFSDISAEKVARAQIDRLAHFDPLTALPNRVLLTKRCGHDISVAQREGKALALVMLGIDHFKIVNDSMGHSVGDQLLKQFAERVKNTLRDQDTIARVGGDEFVLILPGGTTEGAARLAERLLRLDTRPYRVGASELTLTASIGVAIYPFDGQDFGKLFESAEVAMHKAKDLGRKRFQFFSAEMLSAMKEEVALTAGLRRAAECNQLHLNYQPFADLQTGVIGGMEALLRWTHPEFGAVSPATFIPIAERTGLIIEIGNWVFKQVCRDIRDWMDQGLKVPAVSVNISPVQFQDSGLLQFMESTLTSYAIQPGMLCVEVTEGALIEDVQRSEEVLRAFKTLGMKLSLDDFGTGYSSLSYLKRFPFDKVKIDQSFVRDILTCSQDAVIAKVVISMAHGLGLSVIAEGVETEVQCEFMLNNMCDEVQGYFFSRPVPKAELQVMLRAGRRLPAHLVRAMDRGRNLRVV